MDATGEGGLDWRQTVTHRELRLDETGQDRQTHPDSLGELDRHRPVRIGRPVGHHGDIVSRVEVEQLVVATVKITNYDRASRVVG